MIKTLQSLRFVFILLIIFSHLLGEQFDFGGECGVVFFFTLSGFVLSLTYGRFVENGEFSTKRFFLKQLLKCYPIHLLLLIVFMFLNMRIGHRAEWYEIVPSILLVQSWIPSVNYYFAANSVSWFLSDIFFFYALFPSLYRGIQRCTVKGLAVGGIVVAFVYLILAFQIPEPQSNSILYVFPLTRLPDFTLGIIAHRCYRSQKAESFSAWLSRNRLFRTTISELSLVLAVIALACLYPLFPLCLRKAAIYWPVLPVVILYFAIADSHQGGLVSSILHRPLLLFLASISMELYLTHLLVIRVVYSLLVHRGLIASADSPTVFAVLLSLAAMLPVAWLAKKYFVDKIYGIGSPYVK